MFLKSYFAVDHSYVIRKLSILVFPFKRGVVNFTPGIKEGGQYGHLRPSHGKPDENGNQVLIIIIRLDFLKFGVAIMGL